MNCFIKNLKKQDIVASFKILNNPSSLPPHITVAMPLMLFSSSSKIIYLNLTTCFEIDAKSKIKRTRKNKT
ncbi:MAG: hypothetical protein RMJ67_08755 [Elusimicrobiota bacterium]|nr:hypothetical protein [Endomicrobiia bacterium]MDW7999075.1 hypothetical protein [Thermodesulfovibrio sp.]MDW8166585.1 hypothetical protein [Elusimicrobiota bacterium]